MSYILEALKKAQAERQLGSAPTIHATPIQAAPVVATAGARTPLWIAAAVAATLAAVAAVMWWREPAPAAPAVLAVAPIVAEPPIVVVGTPVAPQVAPPAALPPAPAPVVQPAPAAAYQAPVAAPAKKPTVAPPPAAPVVDAQPEAVVQAAALDENLPFLSQLPEPQRSEAPKVSFGGYMYSKNPADRMLIVDKVLRREGEEVAPGLILEQLQPKAAVMNYRGTRYRMAY